MIIKKLKIKNFKKFKDREFDFNDDVNIVVGDYESGKSSSPEAIEIVLNGSYRGRPLNSELTTNSFNDACIANALDTLAVLSDEHLAGTQADRLIRELSLSQSQTQEIYQILTGRIAGVKQAQQERSYRRSKNKRRRVEKAAVLTADQWELYALLKAELADYAGKTSPEGTLQDKILNF